jgi:hypothetical protein
VIIIDDFQVDVMKIARFQKRAIAKDEMARHTPFMRMRGGEDEP